MGQPPAGRNAAARAKAERIAGAFKGTIEPVKISVIYRLGLLLVATAMVLLPLIYIGMIGLVGYGVYLQAKGQLVPLPDDAGLVSLFMYVGPLIIGVILLVFMVKPLFARSGAAQARCAVHRTAEPVLWAFVEQICHAVGSSVPKRIYVDCEVNASAGFRRGLLSFRGDDLVLSIGLPLVAGLKLNQLGGVLAHELGHFSQGTGMRLTYLVRGVNHWFARVVYERDVLDQQLERWSRNIDLRLMVILLTARLFIWITRRILWLLMMLGHAISCFMLRQMEFDADRYEARLAGADCFASTTLQLQLLGVAAQSAHESLQGAWEEERLVDDLPGLIVSRLGQMPESVRAEIVRYVQTAGTGLLDTHPSDRDRIASIRQKNAPGIFHLAAPATVLFENYDRLSKAATRSCYREQLGPGVELPKLVPFAVVEEQHAAKAAGNKALDRFFRGVLIETRGFRLPVACAQLASDPRAKVQQLGQAHHEMAGGQTEARRVVLRRNKLLEQSAGADAAAALLGAGLSVPASHFGIPQPTIQAAHDAANEVRSQANWLEQELEPYFRAAEERLAAALGLLPHPKLAERIPDQPRLVAETPTLVESLSGLTEALHESQVLRRDFFALTTLLHNVEGNEDNADFLNALRSATDGAVTRLGALGAQLEPLAYPFNGESGRMTTGRYVLGSEVLDEQDIGCVYQAVQRALERFDGLYLRVLGRLADIAVRVEAAVGIPRPAQPAQQTKRT